MRIVDFYPSQGSYLPGQSVKFFIEIESSKPETVLLKINIQHFFTQTALLEQQISLEHALQTIEIHWTPPTQPAGYSARAAIGSSPSVETAFDVLSNWIDFPRYGFLTNFSASNLNLELVFKKLTHFHINGLQFYDWQYRHNQLLASTETYIDPLGREVSLATIRNLVKTAHQHGMAAMPYLAIYAASADFWNAHLDWALYDEAGNPIPFGDNFLGLMDPSKDSAWNRHLLAEGARTLEGIPFDGMHIDQYGDPKFGWDSKHNPVDIPKAFVDFIKSAKEQHPDKTVLFNAVGNWPIEALAESVVDFMYIEVWPPDLEYKRLAEIVLNAVQLSHGKAVVIALYLPANRPANNLLADAVILACGGTRIELGEDARLLSDPYFPKHEEISSELESGLKKFNDFAVRNGEWIRPYTVSSAEKETWAKSEFNPSFISTDDSIWTVVRHHAKAMVLSLVNLSGLSMSQQWDQAHVSPVKRGNIFFQMQTKVKPDHIYWDSPESSNGPQKLDFQYSNGKLEFQIPQINYTGLIVIHE